MSSLSLSKRAGFCFQLFKPSAFDVLSLLNRLFLFNQILLILIFLPSVSSRFTLLFLL